MERIKNFFDKHWRAVVIVIAVIYMGIGLFQLITGKELDPSTSKSVGTVLMMLALAIFLYGKRTERMEMEQKKALEEKESEEEIK